MKPRMLDVDIDAAVTDLKERTLSELHCEMARLVYLASTRDYNTGQYFHEGLASEFSGRVASQALALCHRETFERLALGPLEELVTQLNTYFASTGAEKEDVLRFWKALEPHRVAVPADADSLAVKLFVSNITVALAILASGQTPGADSQRSAWQPPSHDQ